MNIDYNFMAMKYNELKEKNELLILIKPRDYSHFDIAEFNKKYHDARAFQISFNDEVIIFIKDVRFVKEFNYKELNREADQAFSSHNTEKAIELYKKLLLMKKPGIHIYARLGLLYLSKNNIYQALIYLKIATGFSLNTAKKKYDFTSLINKITKQEEKEKDEKANPKMNITDFKNDLVDYTFSTRIKEVIILMEFQGMSLEDSCKALNINENEKNIIALYLARDCYARNDFEYGDYLLRVVEKSKNKSEIVKRLFQEIRINRLFYQNRIDENYTPLLK